MRLLVGLWGWTVAALASAAVTTTVTEAYPSLYDCGTSAKWLPGAPFNQMNVKTLSAAPAGGQTCAIRGLPAQYVPCKEYEVTVVMGENLAFKAAVSSGELRGDKASSSADGSKTYAKTCRYRNSKSTGEVKMVWVAPSAAAGKSATFHLVCGQFGGPMYASSAVSVLKSSASASDFFPSQFLRRVRSAFDVDVAASPPTIPPAC